MRDAALLEREMEEAVASHPDLFIEPRLTLVRRQIVINKRRPDILFKDAFDRHLLVELQRGRLDEDHLQRHIYYYFDYRNEYPESHPRLMFVANLVVPQHKHFLDAHGYEYKEIPEVQFRRTLAGVDGPLAAEAADQKLDEVEERSVLESSQLLTLIKRERMTFSYKMLLLCLMAEMADHSGRVPLRALAQRFKEFFERRRLDGKPQENPKRFGSGLLADRSIPEWEMTIRNMPLARLTEGILVDEQSEVAWSPAVWEGWSPAFAEEVRVLATLRLVEYFNRNAGGY